MQWFPVDDNAEMGASTRKTIVDPWSIGKGIDVFSLHSDISVAPTIFM